MQQTENTIHLRVGVDIGGTFTDLVVIDERTSEVFIGKALTTPDDPSRAVLEGLASVLERHGFGMAAVSQVMHATTLVTNAIIERKGASVGLITTDGFRDVLEIGREAKYDLYDLFLPIPAPLVPRDRRFEVPERIDVDGRVLVPLDLSALDRAVDAAIEAGSEAIAICFLHAYRNPAHEQAAADRVRNRYPEIHLSLSSEVAPEIREYERTSTTAANAYVQPLVHRYLGRLAAGLDAGGFSGAFYLMLSNGGLTSASKARERPIGLLESGPAAGALVGSFYAGLANQPHVIAFDMGGTTAKACIVEGGVPEITHTFEAAREKRFKRGSGLPIRTASIELIEIGAGGGSIARIDDLGLLKVGPESAGAVPGPACYAQGGVEPTVTDANVVLGYYNPDYFLGGEMQLDARAAHAAVARLAEELDASVAEAAWGIHDIVSEQMASAARVHIAEKGRDPRRYALLATGGAAPCHATRVANKLRMSTVLCPPNAGVASSLGLLVAPPRIDLVRSRPMRLDASNWEEIEALYRAMKAQATAVLDEASVPADQIEFQRAVDMRYIGQGFEITVPFPDVPLDPTVGPDLARRFEEVYRQMFSRAVPGAAIEGLTWRLSAVGPTPSVSIVPNGYAPQPRHAPGAAPKGERPAYFPDGGYRPTPVYDRYALVPGSRGAGPAIVEERESTIVVPPDAMWHVDQTGMFVITLEGQ